MNDLEAGRMGGKNAVGGIFKSQDLFLIIREGLDGFEIDLRFWLGFAQIIATSTFRETAMTFCMPFVSR